jgi:hypothetical protein
MPAGGRDVSFRRWSAPFLFLPLSGLREPSAQWSKALHSSADASSREKLETFAKKASCQQIVSPAGAWRMVGKALVRTAVDTAWSVYRATHSGFDDADGRRCLLQRHLCGRHKADGSDTEEFPGFGIAT